MIYTFLVMAAMSAAAPVVAVDSGRIAGESLPDGSAVFRGIPYAQPPVGPLRWKSPQPVRPWTGLRDAKGDAPACPQPDQGWNKEAAARTSEDCLYLDVRTPSLTPERPLPVMVWIHGGANAAGSGAGTVMSSIPSRGIVLVSIQYRLGPLGFMSHPALSAESESRTSGNYALMDHQAALDWVKSNIARFGGDPGNVTIFGESAGGQNVGLLMVAPGGRGLFHKAIAESGTAGFGVEPRSLKENEAVGERLAGLAGAPNADAATLRAIPADKLIEAMKDPITPDGLNGAVAWARAVVDGVVLPEAPAATLARNGQVKVPLIIGANGQEFPLGNVAADPAKAVREAYGDKADAALAFYGLDQGAAGASDPRLGDVAMQISSDLVFRCPAVVVAKGHARAGVPVWQYHFDYAPPEGPPVSHASELRYVFNAPGEAGVPTEAAPLQAYWVNFAKTGDPNGPGLPAWPRYDLSERPYLAFLPEGAEVQHGLRDQICDLRNLP